MSGLAGHWLYRGCHLNEDSCLSLRQVLGAFGAPISEAWAWALAHESARTVVGAVASKTTKTEGATTAVRLFLVKDTAELMLHSSGEIHPSSFTGPGKVETPFVWPHSMVAPTDVHWGGVYEQHGALTLTLTP